jgi:drug/metabolite transporter (DMT)-like permease
LGANRLTWSSWYTNWFIPVGIILYIIAGVLLIIALRAGEVSVLYPVFATSFIWVLILSKVIFGEPFTSQKWIGVGIIIFGITLISIGSHRQHSAIGYEAPV